MIVEYVDFVINTGHLRDKIMYKIRNEYREVDEATARTLAGKAIEHMRAFPGGLQKRTEEILVSEGYTKVRIELEASQERE